MNKTALLFAGQGAQVVGMGKTLAEKFPTARQWFDRANEVLGYDLAKICFEGPETELIQTANSQPAIFLVGWAAFQAVREVMPELHYDATAGLSLGEFTALAAAGALSFEDAIRTVRQRGQFMQEAAEATRGAMAAIIGLDEEAVRKVCVESGVELANLNCPGQIVISGEADKMAGACELAKQRGAKKAMPLQVVGGFHSKLMSAAQPKLAAVLASVPIQSPGVPVISNVTAQPHGGPSIIPELLVQQVVSSVRWEASMRFLLAQGFTRFIELGPGKALSGFMKRIDSNATMVNISDADTLETARKALQS